eukprot:CAMPEP_0118664600 /NCGR_PEP_ID=MMETSP0785-20121206/18109_1 /TAXON_ID=91992 /ORGANISM="Bolidomonas pacifica, Strain CCMP 1866" /LENGTH=182 /DNA_ID=CAMNT_0006558537 /DNA_START=223 /DNA_END=768 /DNA_ORIENTATION=-
MDSSEVPHEGRTTSLRGGQVVTESLVVIDPPPSPLSSVDLLPNSALHSSLVKAVTSSVPGNLSPPTVILSSSKDDWLKDRWQAAKDMTGIAIPGEHWLAYEFNDPIGTIEYVEVAWEKADCKDWSLQYENENGEWVTCYESSQELHTRTAQTDTILVDKLSLTPPVKTNSAKLRLFLKRPST